MSGANLAMDVRLANWRAKLYRRGHPSTRPRTQPIPQHL